MELFTTAPDLTRKGHVAVLVLLLGVAASVAAGQACSIAVSSVGAPRQPPAPSGSSGFALTASAAAGDGLFYLAYERVIERYDASSGAMQYIVGPRGPPGSTMYSFPGSVTAMATCAARSSLVVFSGGRLFEHELGGSRGTRQVSDSSLFASNPVLRVSGTKAYVTGSHCILEIDLAASTPTATAIIGLCGSPGASLITASSPGTTAIAAITSFVVAVEGSILGILTRAQALVYSFERRLLDPLSAVGNDFAVGVQAVTSYNGELAMVLPGCSLHWLQQTSTGPVVLVVQASPPEVCSSSGAEVVSLAAATGSSTDSMQAIVRSDAGMTVTALTLEGCGSSAGVPVAATTLMPGPTSNAGSPDGSVATPSASDDEGDLTLIVIIVVVVVVVLLVVIAAAVAVVLFRRSPDNAASEPTDAELKSVRPTPTPQGSKATPGSTHEPIYESRSSSRVTVHHDPNFDTNLSQRSALISLRSGQGTIPSHVRSLGGSFGASATRVRDNSELFEASITSDEDVRRGFRESFENFSPHERQLLGIRPFGDVEVKRFLKRFTYANRRGSWQKGKLLGRGANGSVYGALLPNGSTIALKEINLMGGEEEMAAQVREATNEVLLLRHRHHRNIVTYYGIDHDENEMLMRLFMENVTGGSLGSMVRGMNCRIEEGTAARFVVQIVRGLAFIHSFNIVHRDLKCDNVLRDLTTGCVKLADFGTAKAANMAAGGGTMLAQTMIGTPYFMAPEILAVGMSMSDNPDDSLEGAGYGRKADIWSLGITVAELLNQGNVPWPAFPSPGHAFLHISNPNTLPELPEGLSEGARGFILRCCQRDPKLRPSAMQLLEDPWLQAAMVELDEEEDDLDGMGRSRSMDATPSDLGTSQTNKA